MKINQISQIKEAIKTVLKENYLNEVAEFGLVKNPARLAELDELAVTEPILVEITYQTTKGGMTESVKLKMHLDEEELVFKEALIKQATTSLGQDLDDNIVF